MTELQLGLIGLGVVAVCGVVAYNKWQERRHRALAEQVLGTPEADVLLGGADLPRDGDLPFAEPALAVPQARFVEMPRTDEIPPGNEFQRLAVEDAAPPAEPRPGFGARLACRLGFGGKSRANEADVPPGAPQPAEPRLEPVLAQADASAAERREPVLELPPNVTLRAQPIEPQITEAAAAELGDPADEPLDLAPVPPFLHRAADDALALHPQTPHASMAELLRVPVEEPAAVVISAPAVQEAVRPSEVSPEPRSEPRREGASMPLSPLIDYVASFETVEPASVQQIVELPAAALARLRKPILRVGYNEHTHEWEAIGAGGTGEYRRFRIGLQLVDRQGPASESDLAVFHVAMQDLADATLAIVDLPPRAQALAAAAELDAFCAGVDIQIGINVVSQAQPFPGTKLRALAEAAGMVMDIEGRFVRCDDDGNVLYVLLNQEAQPFAPETMKTLSTHALTFLLDVPCVAHGERVFNQMVDLAKRFADVLRGAVVDDNRRPLSESSLEPIRKQVAQYQGLLAARHLPAGSGLTRRLFS